MVRAVIPFIFWPWFLVSCGILIRRRFTGGSWRAPAAAATDASPIPFEPAPPPGPGREDDGQPTHAASPAPVAAPTPVAAPARAPSRTLAEALTGIAMPCDLAPLMGAGVIDPVRAAFFTTGVAPATVGSALSDELERLGFELIPEDDQSIRARRGDDAIRARLVSAALNGGLVMAELHPSAPEGALVVELQLV